MIEKKRVTIPRATLDIYNYSEDGLNVYEFNATECSPPEPMVNTIVTLEMLKNDNDILRVTFFHDSVELESGDILVTFKRK